MRPYVHRRHKNTDQSSAIRAIKSALGGRSIVMVGLMGCGKSSVGRRLAAKLDLPFMDADDEIEKAAAKSISDIFQDHGEDHFRDGERKVIARLLGGEAIVLATGGGAFMDPQTRRAIRDNGVSIWLKAGLSVLMRRVARRDHRPLLKQADPEAVMRRLIDTRYPVYGQADLKIESRDVPHEVIVAEIIDQLDRMLRPVKA